MRAGIGNAYVEHYQDLVKEAALALLLEVREKIDECRHKNKNYLRSDSVLLAVHKRNHSNRNVKCINDLRGCLGHESLYSYLIICNAVMECLSTAGPRPGTGPWHQLYRAARGSPGIVILDF